MSKKDFKVGNVSCGGEKLFLIAGPCVIENDSVMRSAAEGLVKIAEDLKIPLIFKSSFLKDNRSSLEFYQGPGLDEGLKILDGLRSEFGFPILSDVHDSLQATAAGEVLDVIQIPAYLCMQTGLVVAAAKTGKVVNLKHGQFLAPQNMVKPVKKVEDSGNLRIILTERGYTFGYNDLVVDPRSFYHLQETGYPVVFDITHSIRKYGIPSADARGGAREYLPVLARSGVSAGVDGVFIEVHPDPEKALCDAASQMKLSHLREFLLPLLEFHALEVKHRNKN